MTIAEFEKWALRGVASLCVAGAVTFSAWVTVSIAQRPSRDEVTDMIRTQSPYVSDRAMIIRVVDDTAHTNKELRVALENNTRAIIRLEEALKVIKGGHDLP